ncbi:hypothetical protein GUO98_002832 [Salmonella enterica]|nr:hypothetical protein [Salmonella enterica]EEJ8659056.1 hypothetical protein [Salmonella enterica subsp. enterica]
MNRSKLDGLLLSILVPADAGKIPKGGSAALQNMTKSIVQRRAIVVISMKKRFRLAGKLCCGDVISEE